MLGIAPEGPRMTDLDRKRRLARDATGAASEASGLPKESIVLIVRETRPEGVASGGELICDRHASDANP